MGKYLNLVFNIHSMTNKLITYKDDSAGCYFFTALFVCQRERERERENIFIGLFRPLNQVIKHCIHLFIHLQPRH